MKYVSYKEQKAVIADLKKIYQTLTLEDAEYAVESYKQRYGYYPEAALADQLCLTPA